ncbi:MAG: nuclear transport factor 2 family protein [Betaproteobacteria bacterium]|nr:nuclear transport factor 2 family protein [Betaproteobacteria bacterium]
MRDPVEAQLVAYNARDVEAFLACYTPDCRVEDGAGERLMQGHAEMRERYAGMFATSPNLHCVVVHRTRIGRYVLDEEEITGRVPDFRRAVAIYRLTPDGGRIEHVRFLREK